MSNTFGSQVKITIFGQSHSEAIGVVIDGLPSGEVIDEEAIGAFLARRAPGRNPYSTSRREGDVPRILSGLFQGRTCGAPLCAVIENTNVRSKDYDSLKDLPRPGHADYTAHLKYGGFWDHRGGGHFSGRLTAPLCFAGAVALQILERKGISIGGRIASIYDVADDEVDSIGLSPEDLKALGEKEFPVVNEEAGIRMKDRILEAKKAGDSLGGVVQCFALGVPGGIGEPMFEGLENKIAQSVFAIPGVKGVEFGKGFQVARMRGSENNDEYYGKDGRIQTRTNHHGGSLGGISTGMPVVLQVAFKPTPSIARAQNSVSLGTGEERELRITGRHDPCIVPRAVPCVEGAVAVSLLDLLIQGRREWNGFTGA